MGSQSHGDEVGYLLLEECEVLIVSNKTLRQNLPEWTWLDVCFHSRQPDGGVEVPGGQFEGICTRGNLILTLEALSDYNNSSLSLLNEPAGFDGTVEDVHHSISRCPSCCRNHADSNRSDASLLIGLARTCQHQGHIQIERVQIMRRQPEDDEEEGLGSDDTLFVALLVTFSMPALNGLENKKKKNVKLKSMPPSTKLLYALLRSDWEYLDSPLLKQANAVRRLQSDGTLYRESFFPRQMSLEELYKRIRGLQANEELLQITKPAIGSKSPSDGSSCPVFLQLPTDLIQDYIAPFLRAHSLDALRCSCQDMFYALKAVIPGLRLRLFPHQVRSLAWMRHREIHEWSEHDIIDNRSGIPLSFDNDCHRAVTGGATVRLQSRNSGKTYRLESQFGRLLSDEELNRYPEYLSRKVARGGLLCDDPGLGKTITVLALILQTMGLSCKANNGNEDDVAAAENLSDDRVFDAYWIEQVPPFFQRQSLNKLLRALLRSHDQSGAFYFDNVMRRVNGDHYENNFQSFVDDSELVFKNAMLYYPLGRSLNNLAREMLAAFREATADFKKSQINSAKKSFSNQTARPNSSVAAILQRRARKEFLDSLIPSATTLLIVPVPLLRHWEEQMIKHINVAYLTSKEPVTFRFKHFDSQTKATMQELRLNTSVFKTHAPLLFIDETGTGELPDADFIAMFKIVLTTTKRFAYEWKNGSFEEELKKRDGGSRNPYASYENSKAKMSPCPLLKIHFTRMIVDEGHSMGRGKSNNAILFASWICASRRWSMTGTPTPQTTSSSGMTNLHGLMGFLKHEFFTAQKDGDRVWQLLSRSYNEGSLATFYQVRALLAILMMRHTKLDIPELPPPHFRKNWLDMSTDEIHTINVLVSAIQSNLLLTSMKGRTSGKQDSLLHRSQSKHARLAFDNLRLASCGGHRIAPRIDKKAREETADMLLQKFGLSLVKERIVHNFLKRVVDEERSQCMLCGFELQTLLILPCGDLLCTECITRETVSCPICQAAFDIDEFQKLQPGIIYEWYDYYTQEAREKAQELSQLNQDISVMEVESITGRVALMPAMPSRRMKKKGDGHDCVYNIASADGTCTLCHEAHDECVMISEGSRCRRCYRVAEVCPKEESKFYRIIDRLDTLLHRQSCGDKVFSPAASTFTGEQIAISEERKLKVIIFSQFRKILNLIGHRLIRRYGSGSVAEFWGSYRTQELTKFQMSSDCFCMLLSKDGSEGLDLSYVTHIFFLEEILDKSLQDQVVARAWRMGANGLVEVETLLAKGSVESLLTEVDQKLADKSGDDDGDSAKDRLRSKMVYVLENVRLMGRKSSAAPFIVNNGEKEDSNGETRQPILRIGSSDKDEEAPARKRVRFA